MRYRHIYYDYTKPQTPRVLSVGCTSFEMLSVTDKLTQEPSKIFVEDRNTTGVKPPATHYTLLHKSLQNNTQWKAYEIVVDSSRVNIRFFDPVRGGKGPYKLPSW